MPTTEELANHLLLTAPEQEGWSIVDSPNSSGCYDDLLQWASNMNYAAWRVDFRLRRHELGLVLLWLESEVARRLCGEGTLWPILSSRTNVRWHESVYGELFSAAGVTTQTHRQLLIGCARHYGLRNTFDEEEGQNYYRLIYLQFGFTRDDAVNRLAAWLSGQILPISVQRLLEAGDSGALAFQQVWRSLRMFRLGNLSKATLESRLRSNPWVLPEWCGDLVEAAKKSSAQILEVADLEAAELKFLTTPRLGVTECGHPYFTTSLCNLSELETESEEYELKAGNVVLAKLIRQPDGTYHSDAPEAIALPLQPTVSLSLVGSDGKIAGHDEAVLWDPMEEVSVYSPRTGLMVPAGQKIRSGAETYLATSADICLYPDPAESLELGLGYRLHRVASGWSGVLEARLDDDVVWSSVAPSAAADPGPAGVAARFTSVLDLRAGNWTKSDPPWKLPIHIHIPEGWTFTRLRWKRSDGVRVELNHLPKHLTLVEQDAVRPVVLRVRIQNGTRHRTDALRVPVPFVAALRWTKEGKVYHHEPGRKLLLGDALQQTWSFSLPANGHEPRDPRTCSFLEGGTLHHRLKSRPSTLPDLGGYGAALHIVEDPYRPNSSIMEVAPCVLDGGVLGNVTWETEDGVFHIRSTFTDLGPNHCLLVWYSEEDEPSRVSEVERDCLSAEEAGWRWRPPSRVHLHGVALFFRGFRLGSWFDFGSSSRIAVEKPPGTASETAALLRAWKAPLLQEDGGHFERYCEWLEAHWVEILPVLLSTDTLKGPAGFEWPSVPLSSNWLGVVAELLLGALPAPTGESAGELVEALAPGAKGAQAIGAAVWRIADACPILAARVARVFLKEFVTHGERQAFFNLILRGADLSTSEERAEEIGKTHGNRDGFWLQTTVPSLCSIEQGGHSAIPHAYRLLAKSKDYRMYALGRWLREIQ